MKGPESKDIAICHRSYKAMLSDNNPFGSKFLIAPNAGFARCCFLVEKLIILEDSELEKGRESSVYIPLAIRFDKSDLKICNTSEISLNCVCFCLL